MKMEKILFNAASKLLSSPIATFFFDPLIPKLISVYLSQNLKKWKRKGILESYQFDVQRIGRLCYKIRLHVLAEKKETNKVLADYVMKLLGSYLKDLF